jgi:hypothetical protein
LTAGTKKAAPEGATSLSKNRKAAENRASQGGKPAKEGAYFLYVTEICRCSQRRKQNYINFAVARLFRRPEGPHPSGFLFFPAPELAELGDELVRIVAFDFDPEGLGQVEAENTHDRFRIDFVLVRGKVDRKIIAVCQSDKFFNRFDT